MFFLFSCFFFFFNTSSPVPVSLFLVVSCMCLLSGVVSFLSSSPPLSSERSVTPCLLRAPRSPFLLYPFLAFQCSLVPLCLLTRGEQHSQPPPTVSRSITCQLPSLCDCPSQTANGLSISKMCPGLLSMQ